MRNFKKLISVILTVMMIMSVMPVGMVGANGDVSSQSSASIYPAGAIGLFYEDFESGYTLNENWVKDSNKVTISGGDSINYSFGNWDFQSNLNGQTANTGDSISVVDSSNLNLGGGFSGNALKLRNDRANAYNKNFFSFRRNFSGTTGISLTSGEYAGKKLVYEVDVKVTDTSLGSYTADKQEIFLVPSRQTKVYDYPNSGQWKAALRLERNTFRVEMGSNLGAYHARQISNVINNVNHFKFVLDQTSDVDVMNIWINGVQQDQTFAASIKAPYGGMTTTDFYTAGFNGQPVNFADTIYGLWGSANAMEYYIDNLKAYLVDEFEIESANAKTTGFDPAVDKVEFTFTNEIDATTVSKENVVLLKADGTEVTGGIESVALKNGDAKTLEVAITEAVLGETTYKVAFKGGLKDIYGFSYETVYALDSASGNYAPQMKTANTIATFETCILLEYESATPENEAITEYVQGQDQEITLYFNDTLADTVDIANAFEVKDEAGAVVTGLTAAFGVTKDIVVLQLKDLVLGEGKHTITSKEHALFNSANKYANITYTFDTLDFTATTFDDMEEYMPTTDSSIIVNLSLPTVLTNETILSGFEAVDGEGNAVSGLVATLSEDGKMVELFLADLVARKGTVTIKSTPALVDNRGRTAAFELTFDIVEFNVSVSESSGFQVKPGENKTVTVELSIPTVLDASNIASGFEVITQAGAKVNGLGATLSGDGKTITLQLKDLVVDDGKYFIKSTDALVDAIGRKTEINLMFNVAREVILFDEDFEFGYTLNENWINNDNKVSSGEYSIANGAWEIQTDGAPTTDSVSVVDVSNLNLGGNFAGNALRVYNDRATGSSAGYLAFRRNFNGKDGISLTKGEYAGKKLVYEADIYVKSVHTDISNQNYASPFFEPSKAKKIQEYNNDTYKPSLTPAGKFRIEQGTYAAEKDPKYMWYYTPITSTGTGKAMNLKMVFNQNGEIDTLSFYENGSPVTVDAHQIFTDHKLNGTTISEFGPANATFASEGYDFGDIVYGIWGSSIDNEIYIDNFNAYLIDEFTVESVAVDADSEFFEPSTDSIVYTFSGEVDPATVKDAVVVYDAEGNKLGTAVKSAVLEGGNKVLRVTLAKSLAGESKYKVVLTDAIKDIYGSNIAKEYELYEYPFEQNYTPTNGTYTVGSATGVTYVPASNGKGAKIKWGSNVSSVDAYISVTSTANREVEFTTSRKIIVESISPAAIPGYDLGKDQTVTIKLAEALDPSINLATAFVVTDEDGKNITGLQATFGETTDTIILQLSGLKLGNGKHFIESVDGALANADGIFANVSISVSTVDFMVTYAEPGSEVLTEYKEGDDQIIAIGLSSSAAITVSNVADCFVVTDEEGNVIEGLQATYNQNNAGRSDDDTISLNLKGLKLGKGKHTIKTNANLVDRRGRVLVYEYVFTKLPFKAEYTSKVTGYEPKTDATIDITLTYELGDTSIVDINNAFIVENTENLRVSGLKATVSDDKKVIKLALKDLDISGGSYKITSKTGALVSATNEALSPIMITLETESDATFGPAAGEGAGSGAPLDPNADFSTVVLLDENFENSIEKAEKGIEFIPTVNWYTSPDKIPSIFKVEKIGTEYRDANISIVADPADPASGNMVLKYHTGIYGKDGSLLGTPNTTSSGKNYTILSRGMDKTITLPKDKYSEVRMSTKFYVPASTMANLPLSDQQLRLSQYIIAGTSSAGKTINATNFAKDSSTGKPKFHMFTNSTTVEHSGNKKSSGIDKVITTDEWHTMEYVFSVYNFTQSGVDKGGYKVYVDGQLVDDGAFVSNDYDTLNGMMARLVATDAGGAITVYYDDWKIAKSTKYTTHVDTPATNVPENQAITLSLTKKLDEASVKLIEDSLASDTIEDAISVVDNNGNKVKANIIITDGDVITITPAEGLKYATEYIVEVKSAVKVENVTHPLKAEDGEAYVGLAYPFATAKAKDTYIDAEASAASFNCFSPDMESATRFAYTMNLSGVHAKDVIAAVAVFNEKEELIGIEYKTIPAGRTQAAFDFTTRNGKTGGKVTRMYIWEAKSDGSRGRLMQSPDEITSR